MKKQLYVIGNEDASLFLGYDAESETNISVPFCDFRVRLFDKVGASINMKINIDSKLFADNHLWYKYRLSCKLKKIGNK